MALGSLKLDFYVFFGSASFFCLSALALLSALFLTNNNSNVIIDIFVALACKQTIT